MIYKMLNSQNEHTLAIWTLLNAVVKTTAVPTWLLLSLGDLDKMFMCRQ